MKFKEIVIALILFLFISILFFNKTFLHGQIPFPGDLLISEYAPWSTYSYSGYVPGSYPNKGQYFDVIRQIYPWKSLALSIAQSGQIPLWNPYNFSGSPLMANFQSSVFYPLNIFYLLMPLISAWSLLTIFQILLAGFFTYLFCREIKLGKTSSFFSGIAFSGSLFMSSFLEYNIVCQTILWVPLILFAFEKAFKKLSVFNILLFVFSIVSCFLAGHIQIFGFSLLFIVTYILYRILAEKRKFSWSIKYLSVFFILIFLSLGIVAMQLFPTLELISLSARVNQNYKFLTENLLIQFNQLILFISPDFFGNPAAKNYLLSDSYPGNAFYIGLIPFIFSTIVLFSKKNKTILFFSWFSLVLLLLLIRSPLTELFYSFNIPLFSTGSPSNAVFLLSFSLSVLAGFGFEEFINNHNKRLKLIMILLAIVFVLIWMYIFLFHPKIIVKNFVYSTGLFSLTLLLFILSNIFQQKKKLIPFVFILLTIFDLFYFFQKFNPFVKKDLIFPEAEIFSYLKKKR